MMEDTMAHTHTAPLPKREAKVQVRRGDDAPWLDVPDIDPINLPISDGMADVFDGDLMDLIEVIIERDNQVGTVDRLVWSDDLTSVRGVCPECDDVFVVDEGSPEDVPSLTKATIGIYAVVCGCTSD